VTDQLDVGTDMFSDIVSMVSSGHRDGSPYQEQARR
jgi:hypothetical protein